MCIYRLSMIHNTVYMVIYIYYILHYIFYIICLYSKSFNIFQILSIIIDLSNNHPKKNRGVKQRRWHQGAAAATCFRHAWAKQVRGNMLTRKEGY